MIREAFTGGMIEAADEVNSLRFWVDGASNKYSLSRRLRQFVPTLLPKVVRLEIANTVMEEEEEEKNIKPGRLAFTRHTRPPPPP